ncbi:MAG: amidohydrolase family protein [Anaerolineae bacterium]|nr:amidohydrolase family protein [Anaerolineae bacterium]
MAEQVLLKAKWLLDGTGAPPIEDAALLVRDGRVAAVGPRAAVPTPSGTEEIDLGSYTLLPGLIDAHVHLVGNSRPGSLAGTQHESDEWLLLRAAANAQAALAAGLTTVRDCGGRGTLIISLAKAIAAGMIPGPRIVSCGAPITTTGGHCYFLGLEAEGIEGVQRAVRQMHKAGADFIKVMVTGGGLTPGSNPRRSQYSLAELQAIAEDAHRLGKRVAGHVHGTEGIRRAVAAGFDTLEHCSWLAAQGMERDYDEEIVQEIFRRGIYVCRTIAGFERVPLEEATPQHRLWPDYEVFRNMVKAGVQLIAGSDAGIDETPISEFAYTLETMAGFGGMSAKEVLASATRVAAEAIGLADQVGTLEVGKRADAIAVEGNPLEDLRVLRQVAVVIRDGRIVARNGYVDRLNANAH